jgi:hypothetical protein
VSGRCRAALISHWPAHLAVRSVASCYFSLTIDEEPTLARFSGGLGIDSGVVMGTPQSIRVVKRQEQVVLVPLVPLVPFPHRFQALSGAALARWSGARRGSLAR